MPMATETLLLPRRKGLRESVFWLLAGLSLILLLALMSYSPDDPAFMNLPETSSVENRMGPAGAWFADLSFLIFGRSAFLFPVLLLLGGIQLFRSEALLENRPLAWLRGSAFAVILATSSGLATLHFAAGELRETAGGVIGQVVGLGFESLLGPLGATVLLLVLWLGALREH